MRNFFFLVFLGFCFIANAQVKTKSEDAAPARKAKKSLTVNAKLDFENDIYFPNQVTQVALFPSCVEAKDKASAFQCLNQEMEKLIDKTTKGLELPADIPENTTIVMEYTITNEGKIINVFVRRGDENYHQLALQIMNQVAEEVNKKENLLIPPRVGPHNANMIMRSSVRF